MSEGAMTSTPARTCETAVRASRSKVASLTISYSVVVEGGEATAEAAARDCGADVARTIPKCPCDMYSHRHTSTIMINLGSSSLIASDGCCTIHTSGQAPV